MRSIRSQVRKANNDYTTFQERLAASHPGYAVLQNVATFKVDGVKQLMARRADLKRSAILAYFQAGDSLLGFCFANGAFEGKILASDGGKTTRQLVTRLRQKITARAKGWQASARELNDRLIKPFASQLAPKTC